MLQLAARMQPGWNLGNTMDATKSETAWGNPLTTREMIDAIAASGFKSIRLPVTWGFRSGPAPDYTIDSAAMDRVKELVDWSLDAGLYVVLNMHHENDWIGKMETEHDETLARFKAYWTQITAAFAEYPSDTLLFESVNEPRFSDDWNKNAPEYFIMLDELNNAFYEIVRNAGGNHATRPLVLPTVTCSSEQVRMDELYKTITALNDPYILATVHYYGNYPFSVNMGGVSTFNSATRHDVDYMLDRCVKTFVQHGIPVLIGEYGLLAFDRDINGVEHGEMLKYFDYLTQSARALNIPLFLWDNGQHFDRRALVWRDRSLIDTIMHNMTGRVSTTDRDTIFLKKQSLITDVSMPLYLNGNELAGIYLLPNDQKLAEGKDYTLTDGVLTFTADFLLTLPSAPLGEAGVLDCRFSAGPNWIIRVKQYDTPVMEAAANNRYKIDIPVSFNGDELIAMQAYVFENNKTAGNAGPDSWTPYQQINRCFTPSYENGLITVTEEFFKFVEDGDFLLRFHFLSGEKVTYYINKDGRNVTGEPETPKEPEPTPSPAPSPTPAPTQTAAPTENPAPSDATQNENNWLVRAWRLPAVKVGAGALIAAAFSATIWHGVNRRKRK